MSGLVDWDRLADDVVAAAFPELSGSAERHLVVDRVSGDLEDRVMRSFWSGLADEELQLVLRLGEDADPRLADALDALGFARVTVEQRDILLDELRRAEVAQSLVDPPSTPARPARGRRRGVAVVVDLERRSREQSRSDHGTISAEATRP